MHDLCIILQITLNFVRNIGLFSPSEYNKFN